MVDIQAGEGGDDSKLFVKDLLDMYVRYAHNNSLKTEVLYQEKGKASLKVTGSKAVKLFKNEPGKHVVQRCPPTENKGRRHTSTVTVAIMPIVSESEFTLNDNDIDIKTKRGSGPGGQHRNKTESCVCMKHIPTGITATIDSRDQYANKREARKILESRVQSLQQDNQHALASARKKRQVDGGGRGNKTRTYNFIDNRVVDHNLGTKTSQIKQIMRGKLNLLWKDPV